MDEPASITTQFLAALPPERRAALAAAPDLPELLQRAMATGLAAWPDLALPSEPFLACLAERVARYEDPLQALAALHVADLYLVCAFVTDVPGAALALERRYIAPILPRMQRSGVPTHVLDDVRQMIYLQLLSRGSGPGPALSQYEGRGSLQGWLRVAATRIARRIQDRGRVERPLSSDTPVGFLLGGADPELGQIRLQFKQEFTASLHEALSALLPEERNLLRFYFVDALNIDEIGVILRVHRATVARRLSSLRSKLLADIRANLVQRLRVPQPELDSMLRLLSMRLELSLARLLVTDA